LLGNGDGTFQSAQSFNVGGNPTALALGDFNSDGKTDIVTNSSGTVSVLLGNGDGTFQTARTYGVGGSYPNVIAVGDFNGNGKTDIATASNSTFSLIRTVGDFLGKTVATILSRSYDHPWSHGRGPRRRSSGKDRSMCWSLPRPRNRPATWGAA
jgi:hypothetical protein